MKVLVNRLISIIPLLVIISFVSFLLLTLVPGDPAAAVAGPDATDDQIEQTRQRLGLDRPLIQQYFSYLGRLVRGDLGTSPSGVSVWEPISQRLPVTLSLTLVALALSAAIGVTAGLVAGARAGGFFDRLTTVGTSLAISIPHFLIGIILVRIASTQLGWFPASGYVGLRESPWQWFTHLLLPGLALAAASSAELARQTRTAVSGAMQENYARTALGKGLTERQTLVRHVLKNVSIPIVTVIGLQFTRIFAGAVVVEIVFNLHGLGEHTVNSVSRRDIPAVQGVLMVSSVIIIFCNLMVDLSYQKLNPKVRQA